MEMKREVKKKKVKKMKVKRRRMWDLSLFWTLFSRQEIL
jgi:hypothetical protein